MTSTLTREAICLHEAAHVVAALALGGEVQWCEVEEHGGRTWMTHLSNANEITAVFAGYWATRELSEQPECAGWSAGEDFADVDALLHMPDDCVDPRAYLLATLWLESRNLVREYADEIKSVARHLATNGGRLTDAEGFRRVLDSSADDGNAPVKGWGCSARGFKGDMR